MSESAVVSPQSTPPPVPAPQPDPEPAKPVTAAELVKSDNAIPDPAPAAVPGAASPPAQPAPKPWNGIGRKPGSKNKPKLIPKADGQLVPKALLDLPKPNTSGTAPGQPGQDAQPGQTQPAAQPEPPVHDNYRQSAEATFDGVVIVATMLIGPEWQPRKAKLPSGQLFDERESVVTALEKYYRTKQMPELPPWLELAMAAGVYGAARLREENTQTKLKIAYLKAKGFFGGLWSRLFKRRGVGFVVVPKSEHAERAEQEPGQ